MAKTKASWQRDAALARRRAMRKLNRLKRQGVDLRGTEYHPDPSSLDDIRGMSVKELRAFINRMQVFTSRGVQFYGTQKGDVISKTDMDILRNRQRRLNERAARQRRKFARYVDPSSGMSLQQMFTEKETRKGRAPRYIGVPGVDSDPIASRNRGVKQYASKKAFDKHMARLDFLLSAEGRKYQQDKAWRSFVSMTADLGEEGERIRKQMEAKIAQKGKGMAAFMVLWRDSTLAQNLRNAYKLTKLDFSRVQMGENNPNTGRSGGRAKNVFKAISQTIGAI